MKEGSTRRVRIQQLEERIGDVINEELAQCDADGLEDQ